LFVELDTNDLKVMGAVKKGITTFGGIKNGVNLKKDELVKILDILDNSELIRSSSSTGLFGQKKLIIELTGKGDEKIEEYLEILRDKWREMIDLAIAGERAQLDQIITENPYMVNMMVFFGVTDLPTLSRLNLRFLLEGKHLCYKCKKELKRFMQKFSVSDVRKFNFKLPRGMTTRDDLCADCFNKLTR
jgi:DNA-binding MarR family transcriptional regulator